MAENFDVVVIGAGPAGEKGAAQAAYFNKGVALIEAAIAAQADAIVVHHGLFWKNRNLYGQQFRIAV